MEIRKTMVNKIILADAYTDATMQHVFNKACEANKNQGQDNGYSPSHWFHGKRHYLLLDADEAAPTSSIWERVRAAHSA